MSGIQFNFPTFSELRIFSKRTRCLYWIPGCNFNFKLNINQLEALAFSGDFRVYGPVMPLQAVSSYGEYVLAPGPSSQASPPVGFYATPYIDYSSSIRASSRTDLEDPYAPTYDDMFGDNAMESPASSQLSPASGAEFDERAPDSLQENDYQSSEDEDDDSENGSHYQSIISATFQKYESESKFIFICIKKICLEMQIFVLKRQVLLQVPQKMQEKFRSCCWKYVKVGQSLAWFASVQSREFSRCGVASVAAVCIISSVSKSGLATAFPRWSISWKPTGRL